MLLDHNQTFPPYFAALEIYHTVKSLRIINSLIRSHRIISPAVYHRYINNYRSRQDQGKITKGNRTCRLQVIFDCRQIWNPFFSMLVVDAALTSSELPQLPAGPQNISYLKPNHFPSLGCCGGGAASSGAVITWGTLGPVRSCKYNIGPGANN